MTLLAGPCAMGDSSAGPVDADVLVLPSKVLDGSLQLGARASAPGGLQSTLRRAPLCEDGLERAAIHGLDP